MVFFFFFRYIRSGESQGGRGGGSGGGYGRSGGHDSGLGRRNDRFNGRVEKNGFGGGGRSKSSLDDQVLKRINWSQEQLAPLRKNFYKPSPAVTERARAEVEAYHRKHEVAVRGHDAPSTVFEFNEVGFPSYITTEMARQGFKQPTVIQASAWPIAMSGRDLVGIAQTGSGNFLQSCEIHLTHDFFTFKAKLWLTFCQLLFTSLTRTSLLAAMDPLLWFWPQQENSHSKFKRSVLNLASVLEFATHVSLAVLQSALSKMTYSEAQRLSLLHRDVSSIFSNKKLPT